MEQRRLRLGDILDDYCPRERRVTNHAVVAMIDEDVKQTRCTTCDAEHPYKGGSAPRRRKKGASDDLTPALAGPAGDPAPPLKAQQPPAVSQAEDASEMEDDELPLLADDGDADPDASLEADADNPEDDVDAMPSPVEEGPVHRRLIRATLPRPEGQKDARPATEFTIRQSGGRGGNSFRGDNRQHAGGGAPSGAGNRPQGASRFAGSRPANNGRGAAARGQGAGFRSAQPQQRRGSSSGGGGGRKRSR